MADEEHKNSFCLAPELITRISDRYHTVYSDTLADAPEAQKQLYPARPAAEREIGTLMEVAFWASLLKEEGRHHSFRLRYSPPVPDYLGDRFCFSERLAFTPEKLAKLAPALNAQEVAIGVSQDQNLSTRLRRLKGVLLIAFRPIPIWGDMLNFVLLVLSLAGITLVLPFSPYITILIATTILFLLAAFRLAGDGCSIWFEVEATSFPALQLRTPREGPDNSHLIEVVLAIRFGCKTGEALIQSLQLSLLRRRRFLPPTVIKLRSSHLECREGERRRLNLRGNEIVLHGPTITQPYRIRAYGYLPESYSLDQNHFIRLTAFALDQEPFSVDQYCDWRLAANRKTSLHLSPASIDWRRSQLRDENPQD